MLIQNITRNGIVLNEAEADALQSYFVHKKYRKNQYILQQGDVSRYEIFVIKGILRTYLVDDKGQEHIMKFSAEDWWSGDLASFYSGTPSNYNIDCLEDTEVLVITRTGMDSLLEEVPVLNRYFRVLYRNSVIAYNRRVAATLINTALERYHEFVVKYPFIEQRVPNHQIASYLGITPQSLSRIRRQAVLPVKS